MSSREQRTHERLEALLEYLTEQGTIPEEWREALRRVDSSERGREARERARGGRGPPPWAGGPDRDDPGGGPPGQTVRVPTQEQAEDGGSA